MAKPARRLSILLSALAVLLATAMGGEAWAGPLYKEARYAAIVVDASTGEVLYARRADQPRYPASISKVMTLYLTFEALATGKLKLDDTVPVSADAARQPPSKLGLRPGQSLTVDQALRAVALKSANDIAYALAEKVGGSEARFAALMTLRAHELGMLNTRFVNASGLPDTRQISTARDIAILSRAVMRDYPQYYSYFSQKTYDFRGQHITNHNALLHKMPGVDGIKTGFTNASGYNLAASAVRDGRRLISVVLGGTSTSARDQNVTALLEAGFEVMAKRRVGEPITVASVMNELDDVSGPIQLAAADETLTAPHIADSPTRVSLMTGALPAAAITPGSFSSAWLRPLAFDRPQAAEGVQSASLKGGAQSLADEAAGCAAVKVVTTKVVKSKPRKGQKARTRKVEVVSWRRPAACGPAPQAVVTKTSYAKPEAPALSDAAEKATPEKAAGEKTAVAEKPPAEKAAATAKACPAASKAQTKAAKARRAACLDDAKGAASAKTALRGAQAVAEKAAAAKPASAANGAKPGTGYAIQVGAYKSQADAKGQIDRISKRYGSVVASAESLVQNAGGGAYRARFKGFTAQQAKAACQALVAKGELCMVLSTS